MISLSTSLVGLLTLVPFALGQGALWTQCGGIGWTGATTCVSGAVCTVSNAYYSQCLPSSASTASTPTTKPVTTGPVPTGTSKANFWFSFGDSYTQTGFVDNGVLPAIGNPLGNPPYPGYTATGGENWVDFVTTTYNKSLVFTYNYAYGGATIDASLVTPYEPTVLSLTDQVNEFLTTVANKPASTPWTSSNSLFSIFIGINDIGNSYYQSGDRSAFSDTLLNAEFALVQKLVIVCFCPVWLDFKSLTGPWFSNAGARNFLFVNVPPVDRSPLMLAQAASAQATEKTVIAGFNSKLVAQMASFKSKNAGVQTFLWDSNAQFTTILNSPTTYGFQDATSYGTTPGLFWGNNLHPTSAAHKLFGQQVGQTVLGSTIW